MLLFTFKLGKLPLTYFYYHGYSEYYLSYYSRYYFHDGVCNITNVISTPDAAILTTTSLLHTSACFTLFVFITFTTAITFNYCCYFYY